MNLRLPQAFLRATTMMLNINTYTQQKHLLVLK